MIGNFKHASKSPIPEHIKRAVRERDRNICQLCRKKFDAVFLDYDHIHPYSLGGSNDVDNVQQLCPACGRLNKTSSKYCVDCGNRQEFYTPPTRRATSLTPRTSYKGSGFDAGDIFYYAKKIILLLIALFLILKGLGKI